MNRNINNEFDKNLDINGKELNKGDYIVFSTTYGRSAIMKYGKVIDNKYISKDGNFSKVKVISLEENFYNGHPFKLNKKCGYLTYKPLILHIDQIPKDIKELLDSYKEE
jgi:hypothetical protein